MSWRLQIHTHKTFNEMDAEKPTNPIEIKKIFYVFYTGDYNSSNFKTRYQPIRFSSTKYTTDIDE